MSAQAASDTIDLSFVVIGYNEGATLEACLQSAYRAHLEGITYEVIYVDGGSSDDSLAVAERVGAARILGGERRRRAAENRNLGLSEARGRYVQFMDGDMVLKPDWPRKAIAFLDREAEAATVTGILHEARESAFFRAMQIDWVPKAGPIPYCGGAAMHRRDMIEKIGGFPEDVAYGEEPYMCWRIRNELGKSIQFIEEPMADHDLGFGGLGDYLSRCVRTGATYAEIASRCYRSEDRLWLKKSISTLVWAAAICVVLGLLVAGPWVVRVLAAAAIVLILARKMIHALRRGHDLPVAFLYAVHTYFAKLPLAFGLVRWFFRGRRRVRESARG